MIILLRPNTSSRKKYSDKIRMSKEARKVILKFLFIVAVSDRLLVLSPDGPQRNTFAWIS
jgi:hypothetical protein